MAKSNYLNYKKRNKTIKLARLTLWIFSFLIIAFTVLVLIKKYESPVLTHTWQSEETGIILTFTPDGKVTYMDDLPNGTYHIVSPNTLEYTVMDHTFIMLYYIEDGKLYWGLDADNVECFKRYY